MSPMSLANKVLQEDMFFLFYDKMVTAEKQEPSEKPRIKNILMKASPDVHICILRNAV